MAYLKKFHNRTAFTMVPTQAMKYQLEALGFKNLKVVARGVDTQFFHPNQRDEALRQSWNVKPETLVMLSVSGVVLVTQGSQKLLTMEEIGRAHV